MFRDARRALRDANRRRAQKHGPSRTDSGSRSCEIQHALGTALRGDLAIAFFPFNTDRTDVAALGRDERRAAASEWVDHGLDVVSGHFETPCDQFFRLLCWMLIGFATSGIMTKHL